MNGQRFFRAGRRGSRRRLVAGLAGAIALVAAPGAFAQVPTGPEVTTPAEADVRPSTSVTAQGAWTNPAFHDVPEVTCPHKAIDPVGVPGCVHFVARPKLRANTSVSVVVRLTYGPNEPVGTFPENAFGEITVKDAETGLLLAEADTETCTDRANCAETVPFTVPAGVNLDVILTSAVFISCPPQEGVCPPVPFHVKVTLGAQQGGAGCGIGCVDPPISIHDTTVVEGDDATRNAVFTVSMADTSAVPVTVNYATALGNGDSATAGSDYVPSAGVVVFAPGELVKTITVPLLGDIDLEDGDPASGGLQAETFSVVLTLPQPMRVGTIGDGLGIGRIVNDDWGHTMLGGGKVGAGSFSARIYEHWRSSYFGYYESPAFSFRATRIDSMTFDDLTRSVRIVGSGWNAGRAVTFTLDLGDNGAGQLDAVVLTLSDGSRAQGLLASGNLAYTG